LKMVNIPPEIPGTAISNESITAAFKDFSTPGHQPISIGSRPQLDIKLDCPVAVLEGPSGQVQIAAEGMHIDVTYRDRTRNEIEITEHFGARPAGSSNRRVVITAPANCGLKATVGGNGMLASNIFHSSANVRLSDDAKAAVHSTRLVADLHNQAQLQAQVEGDDAYVSADSHTHTEITGEYRTLQVNALHSAEVDITGPIKYSRTVDAWGKSKVHHRGSVGGETHQRSEPTASVTFEELIPSS
jgi:hypothetical protein